MKTFAELGIDVPPGENGEVATTCPKCSPHRKKSTARCLSVDTTRGLWHCHHCSWSGALSIGEQRSSDPNGWKQELYRPPPVLPEGELNAKAQKFFILRNITRATWERNRICYGQAYIPQLEDYSTAIFFPYFDGGKLKNIKYRAHPKHFCMVAGAELIPYGIDDVREADTVIWVEGEMDKLSMEEAGYLNAISVPNGAPPPTAKNYSAKLDFMTAYEGLFATKKHYLAVDSDEAGQRLQDELSRRLGRENCWIVEWPEGCKDANEVLNNHGPQGIRKAIEASRPFPIEGIITVEDSAPQVVDLYIRGLPRGKLTGWQNVDEHYTVRPGELCVVTGMPGSGKSEWVDALMVNLAQTYGWRFGVFSPENHPVERHIAKLVEKHTGLPFGAGPSERIRKDELPQALWWLNQHFYFLAQSDDGLTVDAVLQRSGALVRRHGINGLVIDPWNELDHSRAGNLTETEYISQCLTKLRRFARLHSVHLWLVAHPTKLKKDDKGKYPAPTLYDISGSAHWRNKADDGITIHRDHVEGSKEVEIHVGKIRFKEVGRVGVTRLVYDKVTGQYATPSADRWS